MTLTDPADIKALLQRHGFRFSKAMGQNFLINPSVCPRKMCIRDRYWKRWSAAA